MENKKALRKEGIRTRKENDRKQENKGIISQNR